ncbi:hypothetical protein WISP_07479 [Willisornis vidua]|uniref:OCA domain-containing protein n=1 Tax=Willisornis vidua TaxID=1566151 RepID=A0ABQ9DT45_9PASS|nr:hypothetical protein WISP_07479 [Willisornis vidua]
MSGKPKVYQGVRVKITVKELLQQRRARQAAAGSALQAASSPSSADLPSPLNSSCSPPAQLCPLTPLTHSPEPLDTRTHSWPGEEWPCHAPCPSPASCCPACGSQPLDSRFPPCFPCPGTDCLDYLPPLAVPEDFFRRDRSCDICYS